MKSSSSRATSAKNTCVEHLKQNCFFFPKSQSYQCRITSSWPFKSQARHRSIALFVLTPFHSYSHFTDGETKSLRSEATGPKSESVKRQNQVLNPVWKVKVLVSQLYLTLWDPMDCNPPGSSVPGILQARVLEWVTISFSRASSDPGIKPQPSALQAVSLPSKPAGKPH